MSDKDEEISLDLVTDQERETAQTALSEFKKYVPYILLKYNYDHCYFLGKIILLVYKILEN